MANQDRAYGFKPWGPLLAVKHLYKDAAAAAFGINDVVLQTTDGGIDPAGAVGASTNTVGVSLVHSATGTAGRVLCAIDPNQILQAQDDGDGTALAQTSVGATVDNTVTTLNTTTKISTMEIDTDTMDASGADDNFLIIDLLQYNNPDNTDGTANAFGDFADYVVTWNVHRHHGDSVGI